MWLNWLWIQPQKGLPERFWALAGTIGCTHVWLLCRPLVQPVVVRCHIGPATPLSWTHLQPFYSEGNRDSLEGCEQIRVILWMLYWEDPEKVGVEGGADARYLLRKLLQQSRQAMTVAYPKIESTSGERWSVSEYTLKIQPIGFPNIILHWLSARGHFPSKEHLAISGEFFSCHD